MAVDITPSALLEFAKTITSRSDNVGNSRVATVTRIDKDGVAYVSLPGGVDETPIATAGAMFNVGDTVYLTMSGGRLRADYNLTAPSIGARVVKAATAPIEKAVKVAKQAADEAGKVANAVNQHFWTDDNGAHVTDVTKDEWNKAVDDGFSDLSPTKQYPNLLENSLGILLRSALNNLVSITRSAIAFYDGAGNAAANIVAQFGTSGAQIGYADETHAELDYRSLQLVDKEGNTYFHVSDLRDASGFVDVTEIYVGDGQSTGIGLTFRTTSTNYPVAIFDTNNVDVTSNYTITKYTYKFVTSPALAVGYIARFSYTTDSYLAKAYTLGIRDGNSILGALSVAEGYSTSASGPYSHAEGNGSISAGYASHAEGVDSEADGMGSHSEGWRAKSYGAASHAEGYGKAVGEYSHAEGFGSVASGKESHAEGYNTTASGNQSHSQNSGTIAASIDQTAIGSYNVQDSNNTYSLIVGNGIGDDERSNAYAQKWDGTHVFAHGTTIWDNSGGNTHLKTPESGKTAQAEYSFEAGGLYIRKRTRTSTTAAWGSWSGWTLIS